MSTDIRTIPADEEAMDALSMMQSESVGRLPVVDVQGEVVGLLTRTDLMNALQVIQSGGAVGSTEQELASESTSR